MRVIAMFAKSFKICTNSALKSFDQPFFKKVVVSKGEALVVPRRERNPLYPSKAPEGGAILLDCGGNHKWGFPLIKNILSCVLAIAAVNLSNPFVPLFLLAKKAQKKKLGKKKYAARRISFPAGNEEGFAPSTCANF